MSAAAEQVDLYGDDLFELELKPDAAEKDDNEFDFYSGAAGDDLAANSAAAAVLVQQDSQGVDGVTEAADVAGDGVTLPDGSEPGSAGAQADGHDKLDESGASAAAVSMTAADPGSEEAGGQAAHADEKLPETHTLLRLSNLNWWTTDVSIEDAVREFGSLRVPIAYDENQKNGKFLGQCTVELDSDEAMAAAAAKLDGADIDGASVSAHVIKKAQSGRPYESRRYGSGNGTADDRHRSSRPPARTAGGDAYYRGDEHGGGRRGRDYDRGDGRRAHDDDRYDDRYDDRRYRDQRRDNRRGDSRDQRRVVRRDGRRDDDRRSDRSVSRDRGVSRERGVDKGNRSGGGGGGGGRKRRAGGGGARSGGGSFKNTAKGSSRHGEGDAGGGSRGHSPGSRDSKVSTDVGGRAGDKGDETGKATRAVHINRGQLRVTASGAGKPDEANGGDKKRFRAD